MVALSLVACGSVGWGRRSAGGIGLLQSHRQDPALSGDGRFLATLVDRGGRDTVVLQEQPSGRMLPLRHLVHHAPHASPSLSWTGRYLAAVVQQGSRRLAVLEDRLSGRLVQVPLPFDQEPRRLSLSPDARRLAVEVRRDGQPRLQLFDLSGIVEPDLPGGQRLLGGGAP